MYACFDQPDLKATFALHRPGAAATGSCVSNGGRARPPGRGRAGIWASRRRRGCRRTSPRSSPAPTPWCATSTTASRSGCTAARRSLQHLDADELFAVTKQGFDFFHRVFGYRYPFGKYDQLFVPEFNAGAMENAGAVTFLEDYVFRSKVTDAAYERRAETVLHEMAHMWFGDLVTMRWWDDLWLNESLRHLHVGARQSEATRWTDAWTTFANTEKTWAYRQDQLPSTHPIAADIRDMEDVEVNFDGITYAKGASVLKQLVAWVGQDAFLAGAPDLLHHARVRQHRAGATCSPSSRRPAGATCPSWSKEWLRDRGRQHAARRVRDRRRRRVHVLRGAAGGARRTTRRCARTASRSALRPRRRRARAHRPRGARRRRRQHRGARRSSAGRSPTSCSSTTTT